MAFTNLSLLLLGGLFIAVPIVLHLIMRRKPRRLEFPALQFLVQRREANRRQLRLRHWLLLVLRCLAILALAAALARPRAASALMGDWVLAGLLATLLALVVSAGVAALVLRRGAVLLASLGVVALLLAVGLFGVTAVALSRGAQLGLADEDAPVAAVLVCDTSPRMLYRSANQTRIERAREMAALLMRQLPRESQVAIVDSRPVPPTFAVDLGAARKAIETLEATYVPQSLSAAVTQAIDLARSSEHPRREIYIFTDLTAAAWDRQAAGPLRRRLAEAVEDDVLLFLIDVGAVDPRNFSLGEVRPKPEVIAGNSELHLGGEIRATAVGQRTVELFFEVPDPQRPVIVDGQPLMPEVERRGSRTFTFAGPGRQALGFTIRGLEPGTHHGSLRIVGSDGLSVDDERHFTVEVADAWPVLLAVGPGASGSYLSNALAPYEFRQRNQERFHVDLVPQVELDQHLLEEYRAVWLVDPQPLAAEEWRRLRGYVEQGGGLVIALGRNANPMAAFNEPAPQELLPGKLRWQHRAGARHIYLAPRSYDHPVLAILRDVATTVPWREFPVETYWELTGSIEGETVIAYNTGHPALVERVLGRGRVMLLTTPVSDPAHQSGRPPWNYLPTNPSPWPFLILVNETTLHLVGGGEAKLNYLAGQPAVLPLRSDVAPDRWQLFTPRGQWQELAAQGRELRVSFSDLPGAYRLRDAEGAGLARGFSVNLPMEVSRLERAEIAQLDEILGEGRYQLARSLEQIEIGVRESRAGREFYPMLITMLVLALAVEHVLANRFYKMSPQATPAAGLPVRASRPSRRLPAWAMPWRKSA